jgi:hypothetical protein
LCALGNIPRRNASALVTVPRDGHAVNAARSVRSAF